MELVEYIYFDQRRLDSYFEQISSPLKYEKVAQWKIGFNITGPNLEGTQQRSSRPFTNHEKFTILYNALVENKKVRVGHPVPDLSVLPWFYRFTVAAQRMRVPLDKGALAVWNSTTGIEGKTRLGVLLIEDWGSSDDDQGLRFSSGFSAMQLKYPIHLATRGRDDVSGLPSTDTLHADGCDPAAYLADLGATPLGPPRKIDAFFRLRYQFIGGEADVTWLVFVGYPICIMEGDERGSPTSLGC